MQLRPWPALSPRLVTLAIFLLFHTLVSLREGGWSLWSGSLPEPAPGAVSSRVHLVALIPAFLGLEACSLGLGVPGGR